MIFRLSQKLNDKIKAGSLAAAPMDENPHADWSAHLFTVDRAQYIIVTNTASLYSIVIPGKGITNVRQFADRAMAGIREFTHNDDRGPAYDQFIAPAGDTFRFAKALHRSVTGSMNELILTATIWLQRQVPPIQIGIALNGILLSHLGGPERHSYGKPREAFDALSPATPSSHRWK